MFVCRCPLIPAFVASDDTVEHAVVNDGAAVAGFKPGNDCMVAVEVGGVVCMGVVFTECSSSNGLDSGSSKVGSSGCIGSRMVGLGGGSVVVDSGSSISVDRWLSGCDVGGCGC